MLYHSGLGSPTLGTIPAPFRHHRAAYTIDPNDGWTAQALGHLAANSWFQGHVPLWNLHEGLGMPHAGEMQSAAFFLPFVLLQKLPNGIFAMHLALMLVAGLSMLFFLRCLRLSWVAATAGGCLFGLNGIFSVMTNAPFNPVAFLPMTLWGVELARAAVKERRRPVVGVSVTALALAWSLYAGFPETALVQGVLVAVWVIMRAVELRGRVMALLGWMAAAAAAGLALAAPILVSLVHFLSFGFTAYHAGSSASWSYQPIKATAFGLPYLVGPFNWNPVGAGLAGYVTLPAMILAIVGFFGPRSRVMSSTMAGVLILFTLNAFGFGPANTLLNVIPGMKTVLLYKYGLVVMVFIVILMAAFGLDDVIRHRVRRSALVGALVAASAYVVTALVCAARTVGFPHSRWTVVMTLGSVVVILVLGFVCWQRGAPVASTTHVAANGARRGRALVALATVIFVADSTAMYAMPQLVASRPERVDTGPIRYLEQHLGTSRFFSLGPIQPNYGSYWGLSQLNVNDLPVAKKFSDFTMKTLKPQPGTPATKGLAGWAFLPDELAPLNFSRSEAKSILRAYAQQRAVFRDASVRYLVMAPGVAEAPTMDRLGLVKVFTSRKTEIWEDREATPYYTTTPGCREVRSSLTDVTLDCSRGATLTRRQLSTPGWTATINGTKKHLADPPSRLYQQVSVPAGRVHVSFDYQPPYFRTAVAASLVTLLGLTAACALVAWRRRGELRRRDERGSVSSLRVKPTP